MNAKRKLTLNVQREEWFFLLLFASIFAVNMITLEGSYVIATSGFLSQVGPRQLPLLLLVDMVVILLTTSLFSLIADRWPRRQLIGGMLLFVALFHAGLRLLFFYGGPDWLTYPLLYLLAEQQLVLFPIAFWALANDVLSVSQSKRLFPLMAASGIIGGILGNSLAVASAPFLASRGLATYELLIPNAVLLLAVFVVFALFSRRLEVVRRQAAGGPSLQDTLKEGWDFVRNVDAFRYLAIAMLAIGFILTVIEYHFLATTSTTFERAADFQTFYGLFRIGQTLATLAVQGLLANRLINRIGLKSMFLVLPVVSLSMLVSIIALPGLAGAAAARLVGRVFLYGVDEPARKSLQGLIPDERRGRVSAFMDGYLYAAGTIVASLLLAGLLGMEVAGWIAAAVIPWLYLVLGLALAAVATWAAWRLRITYDQSMLNWRLARRRRRSILSDLDF